MACLEGVTALHTLVLWVCTQSATAKRGFWKRGNCVKFGFLALTFLSSCYLWRLFGHLCSSMTPETDPCCTTEASKTNPSQALTCASAVRKFAEHFRQNAEIVRNCVSHILDVQHCKTRGAENVGNLAANFLRTPEVQSALQTPLLHCAPPVPILQFRIFALCSALASQRPMF